MAARGLPQAPSPTKGETPQTCRRCELWKRATQAVPGEGSSKAHILLVGEQPAMSRTGRDTRLLGRRVNYWMNCSLGRASLGRKCSLPMR
jgi:uracil-DNA glycosylase